MYIWQPIEYNLIVHLTLSSLNNTVVIEDWLYFFAAGMISYAKKQELRKETIVLTGPQSFGKLLIHDCDDIKNITHFSVGSYRTSSIVESFSIKSGRLKLEIHQPFSLTMLNELLNYALFMTTLAVTEIVLRFTYKRIVRRER